MNSTEYCNECGGEIIGVVCSVCLKRAKITRDIGYTNTYLQEKICDAKKGNKINSVFYNKEFIKDVTGIDKLGREALCIYRNWNYEKIIKNGTVKIKMPRSVIDIRSDHGRDIYFDKELRFKRKKIRITNRYMPGIKFFVDIGFSDKEEKDLTIATGFTSSIRSSKNKKEIKRGERIKRRRIRKNWERYRIASNIKFYSRSVLDIKDNGLYVDK